LIQINASVNRGAAVANGGTEMEPPRCRMRRRPADARASHQQLGLERRDDRAAETHAAEVVGAGDEGDVFAAALTGENRI
jgi:hypothetical protein